MTAKIILHAHAFYPGLWPELQACIENCRAEVGGDSLFVVATYSEAKPELCEALERSLRSMRHEIIAVSNRGYDVGPFVEYVLNRPDFASFDYVVKLHTKRDVDSFFLYRRHNGSDWRRLLLSFCSTRDAFRRALSAFARAPRQGMVANAQVIGRGGVDYSKKSIDVVRSYVASLGLTPRETTVVLGTMFMARTKCLLPLANRWHLSDFEEVSSGSHLDGSLAHCLERHFAAVVSAQGYLVSDGRLPYAFACCAARLTFTIGRSLRIFFSFLRSFAKI